MAMPFRLLVALGLGALAALALAPLYYLPALIVGFSGLAWLLGTAPSTGWAFALGWAFGVGNFLIGLHWIGHAFLVDAVRFAWLMPFAVALLASGLALFCGLATAAAHRLGSSSGLGRVLALVLCWTAAEWLRGNILTGLPWLLLGHVWAVNETGLQAAALLGGHALGVVTMLAATLPVLLLSQDRPDRRRAAWLLAAVMLLIAGLAGYGHWRLPTAAAPEHDGIRLRLVQAGIPQAEKWLPEMRDRNLARYLRLGRSAEGRAPSHLVWPETATSFFLAGDDRRRDIIARTLAPGQLLIPGSPRRTGRSDEPIRLFNSLFTLGRDGVAVARYDKYHLVPFGEYLPLRGLLSVVGLDKLAPGAVDYSAGVGPRLIDLPGLPPFRPLICYEIIFPGEVLAAGRPGWLLNLTNDAWFGDSFGPYQHLDIARLRAVELGLPLVRAANTGVSAIVDPYGRITAQLPLGAAGVIDGGLPLALAPTVQSRLRGAEFGALLLLLAASVIVLRRRV